jgi:hypothetical protein
MKIIETIYEWLIEIWLVIVWFIAVLFANSIDFFDNHAAGLTFLCGVPFVVMKTIKAWRDIKRGK